MDSYINPFSRPELRHTEKTDTRQAIRRPVKDQPHKKRDHHDHSGFDDEDEAEMSVEALKTFLLSLLKSTARAERKLRGKTAVPEAAQSQGNAVQDKKTHESADGGEAEAPKQPMAARAAQAYQQQARAASAEQHDDTNDAHIVPSQDIVEDMAQLSPDDAQLVRGLIKDLDLLMNNHIHSLVIQKQGDFLQSILRTVKMHKSAIRH